MTGRGRGRERGRESGREGGREGERIKTVGVGGSCNVWR